MKLLATFLAHVPPCIRTGAVPIERNISIHKILWFFNELILFTDTQGSISFIIWLHLHRSCQNYRICSHAIEDLLLNELCLTLMPTLASEMHNLLRVGQSINQICWCRRCFLVMSCQTIDDILVLSACRLSKHE